MSSGGSGNGFLQGLGISAGLITAPILITVGIVLAIMLLCCYAVFVSLGALYLGQLVIPFQLQCRK